MTRHWLGAILTVTIPSATMMAAPPPELGLPEGISCGFTTRLWSVRRHQSMSQPRFTRRKELSELIHRLLC